MKLILNALLLTQIQDYIYENGALTFKLKGFLEEIKVYCFSYPNSFDDANSKRQLKNAKLNSFYELMNVFYKKVGIDEVDLKTINEDDEFFYLHIDYFTKPSPEMASYFRHEKHNFMITQTGNPEIFKATYHKGIYIDSIKFIIDSEYIDSENPQTEIHKEAVENLEKIIYGICKKANIQIPKDIDVSKFENLIIKTPEISDFEDLLQLITRNVFDDSAYKKDAKRLQTFQKKEKDEMQMHKKFRDILADYYVVEDEICVQDLSYYSDWKFNPEDIELGISNILAVDFTFAYPSETYSHDLFPYIQTELAKQNLELINCDTFGDSYLFFVVNKNEVDRVFELSQAIGIKFKKLN